MNAKDDKKDSVKTSSLSTETLERMVDAIVTRPAAVRRLVAQFDTIQIGDEAKNSDDDLSHEKSLDSGAGGSSDGQFSPAGSQLIEECSTLLSPTALENSIPLTGQTLDEALSQPTPEPELAHSIHSGLRECTVLHCQPNMKNLDEVVVSELQANGQDVAMKVCSEDSANLLSGEHFRKLLVVCKETLEKRVKSTSEILDNETDIPESAADTIRLATGKANLLLSKKIKKFSELIDKNLNPVAGDLQPAEVNDLSAYWDLVKMELSDIEHLFSNVDLLRKNKWQPMPESLEQRVTPLSPQSRNLDRSARKDKPSSTPRSKDFQKNEAAEKQRRQALAEAKRKLRERMQQTEEGSTSFVM
uniref:Discs, largehomolog-associated protein 5 n=1 Tax=Syphacia muris TaxID=451379 RepID=A0A0N5AGX4_9BILA